MTIYYTKTCPACKDLKDKLDKKKIKYTEVLMTEVEPSEQRKLQITSVPTVFHKGKRYSGLSLKELYA